MASSSRTDAEAIAASLAHPRAFEAVFDRHFSAISRYLRRRLNREVADELAAEVFTTAFAKRRSYDVRRSDALPWLYGIAVNLVRRHARDEQQELRAHARAQRDADWAARGPLDELLDGAVDPEIADALLRLDRRHREVLLLYAWANLDYDEIATALELPLGTVKSRLNRARAALRASLCGPATSTEEAVNG